MQLIRQTQAPHTPQKIYHRILYATLLTSIIIGLAGCSTQPRNATFGITAPASSEMNRASSWLEIPSTRPAAYTYYLDTSTTHDNNESPQLRDFVMLAQRNDNSDAQAYPIASSVVQATIDCQRRNTRINMQYHYTTSHAQGRPVQTVPGDDQFRPTTDNESTMFLLTQLCPQ